ncbi:39S ribosomal protein L33; mitochondrial [Camelus dromedarius]|nr:39S ribosomal protein L33; mitochondrial [Camelus dromedarius]
MLSQAGTGYTFNTKRSRLREKLTLLHYDPVDFWLEIRRISSYGELCWFISYHI